MRTEAGVPLWQPIEVQLVTVVAYRGLQGHLARGYVWLFVSTLLLTGQGFDKLWRILCHSYCSYCVTNLHSSGVPCCSPHVLTVESPFSVAWPSAALTY